LATKPEAAEPAKAPAKSKKMLIIVVVAVLVLALAAGGGWFYISKQRAAAEEGDEETASSAKATAGPPTFLPLDNMVVNLADPGGEKVAQVGITLEIIDAHGVDTVKVYLPAIRSGILLLISQRTAEELLKREGKEKLAQDILAEAGKPFGGSDASHDAEPKEGAKPVKKKKAAKDSHGANPVKAVLFSSFIVQ
jgi:flagellar protein FliL